MNILIRVRKNIGTATDQSRCHPNPGLTKQYLTVKTMPVSFLASHPKKRSQQPPKKGSLIVLKRSSHLRSHRTTSNRCHGHGDHCRNAAAEHDYVSSNDDRQLRGGVLYEQTLFKLFFICFYYYLLFHLYYSSQ